MSEPLDYEAWAHESDQLRKERREGGYCVHDQPPEHCRQCHPELGPYPNDVLRGA